MNVSRGLKSAFMVAGFFALLSSSLAAELPPVQLTNAAQQTTIEYRDLDPLVISTSGDQSVVLSIQTSGSPPEVELMLVNGTQRKLDHLGNGLYSTTITHSEALYGNGSAYVYRNYIGYLDLNNGSKYQLFISLDDGSIPEVAMLDLEPGVRISPRIVNFLIPRANPTQLSLSQVTRLFYQYFPDEFDFINIVTIPAQYRATYFLNIKNSTKGLGLEKFDNTSDYGSSGRLEGIVRIPIPEHLDLASPVYLRMLGYNWMNYTDHPILSGATPHWPISHLAWGIMGYQDKSSSQYRRFPYYFEKYTVGNFLFRYWTGDYFLYPTPTGDDFTSMELYLMGLIPASEAGGFAVLENQYQQVCSRCVVKGPLIDFHVNHLIAVNGPRVPDFSKSRKNFKAATIIVSNDRLLTPREIRFFDHMAARGEGFGELPYSSGFVTGSAKPFRNATFEKGSLNAVVTKELEFKIDEGLNDAWFDPNVPGQGFFVNVLPKSRKMFIGWFTYAASRPNVRNKILGDAYHRWLTAIGDYSGSRAELTLYKTTGGVFNSATPVEQIEMGKLVFKLRDCGHADIEYDIKLINDFVGQIPVQRIANENVSGCDKPLEDLAEMLPEKSPEISSKAIMAGKVPPAINEVFENPVTTEAEPFQINEGLNGAWFNPDWPGQGFFVGVLPDIQQIFLGWFTFDTERLYEAGAASSLGDLNQRWMTAIGSYTGNEATLELTLTSGGLLLWKAAVPVSEVYGSLEISFIDCENATILYEIPSLKLEGEIPIVRISDENTANCQELAAAAKE